MLSTVVSAAAVAAFFPRPKHSDHATFARWLVHEANWTTVATQSQLYGGTPYANLLAVGDGSSATNCTGRPYLYFAEVATVAKDLKANPHVSLGFFEAGLGDAYCMPGDRYDPEDPNCAKAHLVGTVRLLNNTQAVAEENLFWRHPAMANWPKEHGWVVATLDIERVDLLDFYGGLAKLTPDQYFAASCH